MVTPWWRHAAGIAVLVTALAAASSGGDGPDGCPAGTDGCPNVHVFPPGPLSRAAREDFLNVVGRSEHAGLYGVALISGEGATIKDIDGNTYIDCFAAASSNILGYSVGLEEIYAREAAVLMHPGMLYSVVPTAGELARELIALAPGDWEKKVLFATSGSDASSCALKAARKATGRMGVLSFSENYHGNDGGLGQLATDYGAQREGHMPYDPNFVFLRWPRSAEEVQSTLAAAEGNASTGLFGSIIFEPIQGDAGIIPAYPGFLKQLAEVMRRHGVLLIDDEVQAGMGRTGQWWAIEHDEVEPDIMVLGKGISAGYAVITAVIGRAEVMDALQPGQQIITYAGHPPSAAVALEVLRMVPPLLDNVARLGEILTDGFKTVQKKYPKVITDVRGRGLMLGVSISTADDPEAGKVFATRVMEKGVYCGFLGLQHEVLRVEPPYVLTPEQAAEMVRVVEEVASEFAHGTVPSRARENAAKYASGL